ncbi:tRNA pseudouridine(38-40) synthase TruA [Beggiatoa leptomitoformis]|uniref:tRNA pseudouridine synthase A n=1 Tax=Beggiatoa leptomitoformis TaxID=288004 RepID=A0A2N9YJJ2_9GAMM|nr:tRNA pseudouridine(38-40) synthase TruA [Beggiatoa leptomitoformis]ALG67359.1 tRNA pseudouridine(38-40) synthase TruA [Beggiatoa leptomitoformis]AUI70436.1 tRNA pseudouridine(38-40) synthase TruA [Beggiatoa leptomitoformis]
MRIALGVEYNGAEFCGWQIQEAGVRTVQGCVEHALSIVANHPVTAICAGRTDKGVHALSQVIHINVTAERTMRSWILGTNVNMPNDIGILWAQPVDDHFHARFSALGRYYRYVILNRTVRPALLINKVAWDYRPLDIERMQAGGDYLLGTHDFTSYRAVGCQAKNPVRTIKYLTIKRQQDYVIIEICANAFLHHMVRNIAGVLIAIGCSEQSPEWAKQVLDACDRTAGGVTAPASGLYFQGVIYPEAYQFPQATLPVL